MNQKKKKLNWKKLIVILLLTDLMVLILISGVNIINWSKDNIKIDKQVDDIIINTDVDEVDATDIVSDEANMYFDYMKMNMIDVNINDLKKINNDTKGWIQVSGTNINYPFVQTTDNDYYLTHAFDKTYNKAGWVFADFRNKINGDDKNLILYAHGRVNKTMFGSLKDSLKDSWFKKKENHLIKTSTEHNDSLWQIFSVYKIPTTNDYIQTDFISDDEYQNFLNTLFSRSVHSFDTTISSNDKIITLSTCYNKNDKVVIHAKLIGEKQK